MTQKQQQRLQNYGAMIECDPTILQLMRSNDSGFTVDMHTHAIEHNQMRTSLIAHGAAIARAGGGEKMAAGANGSLTMLA